jgi:ectoine hydroxylase-related dioxygenase (phytanoyl-CoA dioxygenase family)
MNQEHVNFYIKNGFVLVKGMVSKEVVEQIRRETQGLHERLAGKSVDGLGIIWEKIDSGEKIIRQLMGSQNISPTLRYLSEESTISRAAERLLGESVELFHSKLMMKTALKGSFTPWHSDWGYWQTIFKTSKLMNAFLAIDSSTVENGCIRYVPGSHRQYQEHQVDHNATGFDIGLPGDINAYNSIAVEMEPGDVAFHDAICVHGSEANHSPRHRMMNTFAFTVKNNVIEGKEMHFDGQRLKSELLLL